MAKVALLDTHCHIDQYEKPLAVIRSLDTTAILAVAVTTSPSAFALLRRRYEGERHLRFAQGQKVIGRLPKSRMLVETDGPYVKIGDRPATPIDVDLVYQYLSVRWSQPIPQVVEQVYSNFLTLLAH